jgi:hypothetical protein
MDDNNFNEENEKMDDEEINPVDLIVQLAHRLCCIGTRDIVFEDALEALFLLWRQEKNFDSFYDVYFQTDVVDEGYQALKDFNFAEFQKTVLISNNRFADVIELSNAAESKKEPWRLCRFDEDKLSGIPHLFHAEWNLKLDLRTGDCYKSQEKVKRLSREDIISIRNELAATHRFDLPPLAL